MAYWMISEGNGGACTGWVFYSSGNCRPGALNLAVPDVTRIDQKVIDSWGREPAPIEKRKNTSTVDLLVQYAV